MLLKLFNLTDEIIKKLPYFSLMIYSVNVLCDENRKGMVK